MTVGLLQCTDCNGRTFDEINNILPNHNEINNSVAVLEGREVVRCSKFVHLESQNIFFVYSVRKNVTIQ